MYSIFSTPRNFLSFLAIERKQIQEIIRNNIRKISTRIQLRSLNSKNYIKVIPFKDESKHRMKLQFEPPKGSHELHLVAASMMLPFKLLTIVAATAKSEDKAISKLALVEPG